MGAFSVKNRPSASEREGQRIVLANVARIIVKMGGGGNTGLSSPGDRELAVVSQEEDGGDRLTPGM